MGGIQTATTEATWGLVVVDKPLGWTSMQVVRRVRRAAGGVKTGHTGTLDPLATGVVLCCLGRATRWVPALMDLPKVYRAGVDLSAFTSTDDREGPPQPVCVPVPPTSSQVAAALRGFLGWVEQTPPAYSAVHVAGQRAYKRARRGESVQVPSRRVRVDQIELLGYTWPIVDLRITCGKGTYIRSIARDLGLTLGTGGHLASLCRQSVGRFDLGTAVTADRLEQPLTEADLARDL